MEYDNPTVIIDGKEYELAPNTIETAEKLEKISREYTGKQPQYKTWLAEIEVLLGKEAKNEIFCNGKSENIDRIHKIHHEIANAFNAAYNEIEAETETRLDDIAAKLAPFTKFLEKVQAMENAKK